jgi:hypothetical protein
MVREGIAFTAFRSRSALLRLFATDQWIALTP